MRLDTRMGSTILLLLIAACGKNSGTPPSPSSNQPSAPHLGDSQNQNSPPAPAGQESVSQVEISKLISSFEADLSPQFVSLPMLPFELTGRFCITDGTQPPDTGIRKCRIEDPKKPFPRESHTPIYFELKKEQQETLKEGAIVKLRGKIDFAKTKKPMTRHAEIWISVETIQSR